jgi:hypothetical protein
MRLVMAALVHPVQGESAKLQDLELLKLANCWLQRKSDGRQDSLLLIGVDFPQVEDLRKRVAPLGLRDVDLDVITMEEDSDLGAEVELVVGPWLKAKHPYAVSFMNWESLLGELVVPDLNWWWTGVEAKPAEEYSPILEGLENLVPNSFRRQIPTWLELTLHGSDRGLFDSEQAKYEICMDALGLARWLHGYQEVSGNGYFDFDYWSAATQLPIDQMRLSEEVWRNYAKEIKDAFYDEDATQATLCAAALKVCLANRVTDLASTLRDAFGGATPLLWALYSAIWPNLEEPCDDAYLDLFSGTQTIKSELMPQWNFVNEGWGYFEENY